MLMFSITKPKKKLKGLLIGVCVALLLGVGVPVTYSCLRDVDAMASWAEIFHADDEVLYVTDTLERDLNTAEIEIESMTGDPIKVNAEDEQAEPDAKGQKRDDSTEGAAGAAAADKDAANNDSAAESEAGTEDKAEAEQEEKGFIKKVLAVIFGSDDEVIYYKK